MVCSAVIVDQLITVQVCSIMVMVNEEQRDAAFVNLLANAPQDETWTT